MGGNHTDITVPVHGGLWHSTCIFVAKYICNERGYKLKNTEAFATLFKSAGIPDIYIEYEYKGKDDYGQLRTIRQSVVIEIETNLTNTTEIKKTEQFSRPGMHEPIIIDVGKKLDEFKKRQKDKGKEYGNDIELIYAYLDERIVL